jgi:uncharacterized membrane protein YphA (DoxX/SURF4 family)
MDHRQDGLDADPTRGARFCRYFNFLARWTLGGVLLFASWDKLHHPATFARAVYNFQILPDPLVNLTAIVLPWLELVLGLLLVAGVWLPGALVWCNLLLATFTGAMLFNLARGVDVQCGCFNASSTSAMIGLWDVLRDLSLLALALYLLVALFTTGTRRKKAPDPSTP